MRGGVVVIKTELETKSFEAQINSLERDLAEYEQQYEAYINAGRRLTEQEAEDFEKLKVKIEQTKNKIVDLTEKQMELQQKGNFKNFSLSIGDVIKKVARWGLALFGIRSAYMGIRSAISTLSQDNKRLAADIQYIKWSLAKLLEPVILRIVNWVYKLIQGINYLIYRITGVNLLSKMTAKNFKSASKSAKELQKSLQGFDEANILNKPSGAGGGGISLPSEDLSNFDLLSENLIETLNKIGDTLKPIYEKYLKPIGKWIIEKPSRLLEVLGGILGLKLASKIAKIIGVAGTGSAAAGASGLLGMLGILGLLVADAWLIHIIVNSEDYKDLKKNIKEAKEELHSFADGVETSTKNWKENSSALVENAKKGKYTKEEVKKLADGLLLQAKNQNVVEKSWRESKKSGSVLVDLIRGFNGEIGSTNRIIKTTNEEFKHNISLLEEMWKQDMLDTEQKKELAGIYEILLKQYEEEQGKLREDSKQYKEYNDKIKEVKENIEKLTSTDHTIDVKTEVEKQEIKDIEKNINNLTDTSHTIQIKASTKEANKSVKNWLTDLGSTLFATLFPKLNFTTTLAKFHRMGGIVNLPGRGVPITHYGGEGGREGIIPMDEEAQMDLIGQSIAKHVTINLTNITKLDSRQLAKETRKVMAENDFATNGGA